MQNGESVGGRLRPRVIATAGLILATAVGLAVAGISPASAADARWELRAPAYAWVVSPSVPDGECLPSGTILTDDAGAAISTLLFPDSTCTDGAGQQCRSSVQSVEIGYLVFDASSCQWRDS